MFQINENDSVQTARIGLRIASTFFPISVDLTLNTFSCSQFGYNAEVIAEECGVFRNKRQIVLQKGNRNLEDRYNR